MLYSLCCRKSAVQCTRTPNPTICFLFSQISNTFNSVQNPYPNFYSTSTDESTLFTISYLTNTCGLSQKEAIQSAKKLQLKTSNKPDSVLNAFQTYGFTKIQIGNIVAGYPPVLIANPQKTLVPKFEFLTELGFSGNEIADLIQKGSICKHFFMGSSLEHKIRPCFYFIKALLQSKEDVASAIKRHIFEHCPEKDMQPKVQILEDLGVPQRSISMLLLSGSRLFGMSTDAFTKAVKEAIAIGVDPSGKMFIYAVRAMSEVNKVKREAKFEIYKSFGWTCDQIYSAIRRQPTCMTISEKKLKVGLDYFMNEMNWQPARLAAAPNILGLSMDKRIVPRVKVVQFLISKGIYDSDALILNALLVNEANFIKKFVAKYEDKFPKLNKVYQA